MIYTCKINFQQPTTAALMETLFKNVFIRSLLTQRCSALETLCLCAI